MSHLIAQSRLPALALGVLCALGGVGVAVAQPSVSKFVPMGVAPGKTTEIRIEGTKLTGLLSAWTSFPAHVELPPNPKEDREGKSAVCKVTLSPNVSVGIGGVVLASPAGASDVLYVMIDDLPTVLDAGTNHGLREAQEVALPVAVEGESDGTLADYYRLSLKRGQPLSVEVVAARLGQDFDAVIRLLDDTGNELLLADDDPASGADARFSFSAPKDGNYLLELRDNRYKPGGRYRLRLGSFPLVSTTLPPVLELGVPTEIEFRGPEPLSSPLNAVTAADRGEASAAVNLGFRPANSQATGWATPILTNLPIAGTKLGPGESRKNVAGGSPGAGLLPANQEEVVDLPCVFYGAIERSNQRDSFAFKALKGKPLRFKAISRSAGSPAIVALRIVDPSGKQLAESTVTESDEPILAFTPPADGKYQLAVDELAGRFGSDFVYAIECQFGPQFTLTLKNDVKNNRLKYAVPSGGAFYLDVQCQRAGYDGPILLAIDSQRSGWQLINATIPAKANEVRMYVQPLVDFAPGDLSTLRVYGKAEQAGHTMTANMSTLVQLRAARPQTPYPPRWHDGLITVSAQSPKAGFYTVSTTNATLELPRTGGETQLSLDFERTNEKFKDTPLVVVPVGLPAGVTAEIKRNGNGAKETYEIRLKSGKDVAAGQHVFRYFAFAELSAQGRGFMSGDIVLNVAGKPIASKEEEGDKP